MADSKWHTRLGTLAGLFYRLYSATWSYDVHFPGFSTPVDFQTRKPRQSYVFGHWHGDELALIGFCRHSKFLTLSSQSKDGSIMAAALKIMGFRVARGSSSRGGMRGLVSMIRMIKGENFYVSFALDGPTGPRHQAKPGIHLFASKARLPVYQCVVECRRKWRFRKTWNQTYLPKPFARIQLYFYELPPVDSKNRDELLALMNSRTSAPAGCARRQ
jgi:lysophospholipid acyltransferase (LPLAT)-like uncharacterized protein